MPHLPAMRACRFWVMLVPMALITPMPVTNILLKRMILFCSVFLDVGSHRIDVNENFPPFLGILDGYAIFAAQQHDEFYGVNRVETETFAKKRYIVFDLFR